MLWVMHFCVETHEQIYPVKRKGGIIGIDCNKDKVQAIEA